MILIDQIDWSHRLQWTYSLEYLKIFQIWKKVLFIYLFIGYSYNTVHKISDEESKKSENV